MGLTDSDGGVFDVTLDHEDLFIDGPQLGSGLKGQCYLRVFPNTIADTSNYIYLGNTVLAKYYVVYDATPVDDYGFDFL